MLTPVLLDQKQELEIWRSLSPDVAARPENAARRTNANFQRLSTLFESIRACGKQRNLTKGSLLHAHILKRGLLNRDLYVGTALVHMYAKCGALTKAQEVFDELPTWDVASCNALLAGYAREGLGFEALLCFERMLDEGISPDAITFVCILKACGSLGAAERGEEIHAEIIRCRFLEKDIVLGTALVDMYAKCGALAKAREVFDRLPERDVPLWTALMTGYFRHGFFAAVVDCYDKMRGEGLFPDAVTFACVLKALGNLGASDKGEELHAEVSRWRLADGSKLLGNALIDMYSKWGALERARQVLDELWARDIASWTTLIAGYAQHGLGDEALKCLSRMRDEGLYPNAFTYVCILKACGSIGALQKGEEIYSEIRQQRLVDNNLVLGNALVDMYANCGMLAKAAVLLDELPQRDVVSWTALMGGYAQLGDVKEVIQAFTSMLKEQIKPDTITFVALLTACCHAGLVTEGQAFFNSMSTVFCIIPSKEHYICMVDLFSSAGQFDKALIMIKAVPSSDSSLLWLALLGACQKWVNVELGSWAFGHAVHLDLELDIAYIGMSNLHAAACIQNEAVA